MPLCGLTHNVHARQLSSFGVQARSNRIRCIRRLLQQERPVDWQSPQLLVWSDAKECITHDSTGGNQGGSARPRIRQAASETRKHMAQAISGRVCKGELERIPGFGYSDRGMARGNCNSERAINFCWHGFAKQSY